MRTLRSGKPLPDPPPVMRGSRGEVTPSAKAASSSVAKAPVVAAAVEEEKVVEKVTIPTTAPPPVVDESTTEEESPAGSSFTDVDNLFIEKVPQPETPKTTLTNEVTDIKDDAPIAEAVVMSEPPPITVVKRGRGRPPKYPKVATPFSTPPIPVKAKVGPTRKSEPASLSLARKRLQLEEELKSVQTSNNKEQGDLPKTEDDSAVATPPLKSDNESHPSKKIKIEDEVAGLSATANLQEKEEVIAAAPKVPPITISTATPELRRSLRCPKKKPAVIVQATMAVERDAQPFLESCTICGEEFNKKMLLQRHIKTHKTPEPPKKISATTTPKVVPRPKQPPIPDNDDQVKYENDYDDDDDDEEEGFEDYEEGERSFDMKPPIIDFTRKRPSQSSILMKDPVTCNVCGMTFTRRAHLNRHMLLHTGIKPFTCDICNLKFTRKDHMFAHKVKHEKEHKIQCAQCGGGFATWQVLQDHIKNVHSSFKPATPGRPKTVVLNTNPDNACDICGKTFLQRRYLRAHRKLHIRKEASILAQLRMVEQQHFNDDEDSNQDMDNDDGEFDDTGDMEIDESILNPEVQIDDRSSSPTKIQPGTHSPSSLGRQEQDASPASTASSKQSSTTTKKSLSSMNRVIQLAEESSGGSGSEAGSHDSSVVSVENANLDKDELDDFIDYDYKAMMQLKSGNFEDFGDDDDDDEDFPNTSMECSVCGTTFTERAELRKHYRIHKKKFICRFCGLKLASAGSLMRHNLIHTGKKEFSCKLCSRRFSRKDTLMVHLQAHEKSSTRINMPKPYLCKVCHAGYTMKYNLIRHIKMCHGSMTATNRAAILKQIEQKYKNGIPSSSNKVDRNSFEGLSDDERQFFENGDVKIKHEPMDGEEGYFEEDLNPFDEEIDQDYQEDESHSQRHDDSSNQQNGEAGGENGGGRGGGLCNHCGKVFKNAKSLNTHKWYHSRDKQFICHICNRGFKYSTDLGRHINTHGNDSEKCSTAPATTVVSKPIPNTNSGQSSSSSSQIRIVTSTTPGQRFIRHQLGRPINSIDTRPFGCKICPQRFNHRSNLSRHVRLIHKATNPRTRAPTSINLQNYLPKVQPIKLSNGQIVQVRRAETQAGSIRVASAQPQKQPAQYASTTSSASGGGHSSSSFMSSSWNGNVVGMPKPLGGSPDSRRSSAGSTVLTPDSFTFDPTSDRPYICNTCGKSFESKNNLWTHCRIHNKIFGCEFCGLKMATRGDLILHLRTHTGEKPFECDLCDWKFSRKSGLNKHMEKYHGPDGKQLRTYKIDQSQGSSTENIQMNNSGMEISTITAMTHRSIQSGVGMLKSVMHKNGTGLTITKIGGTETNVARYSCRLCNTILIGKVQYIRHMNAHSKTKENADKLLESRVEVSTENPSSFTCKECGQVYESQELLTKHILTHSESDAPRCILCGKSCTSLGFLKRHYQYVHPGHPNPLDKILSNNASSSSQESEENVTTTINGDNSAKPTVVRKVIRGENGEEESDEEFPNESDDPPNLIKPQEKRKESTSKPSSLQVIDVDNLDVDEIVYAANNHNSYKKAISQSSNSTVIKRATNTLKPCICPVVECQRDFQVKADLLKHMRRHVQEQRHQCRICTARFPHKQDAHRHMKAVHNFTCKSRNFPCDFCDLHYANEPDLSNHLKSVHEVTLAEVFDETVDDYDSHEEEEMETSGNNEIDYELMTKHRDKNEEDVPTAAADAYVEADEDEIPDPTSFLEQSMGVSATSTSAVTKGEQNGEYFCELCNKVFETRQKWLYHRYYHIREEKYFCSHCDEKFKLRSHLERHIRTYHNEEKPVYNILTCDQCPRKFTREYDLTTHIQKVHLQIPPAAIQKQRLSVASSGSGTMVRVNRNSNPISILKSQIAAQSSSSSMSSMSTPKPSTSRASISSMLRGFPKGVTVVRKSWPTMTAPQNKDIIMTKVTPASAKPVPPMQKILSTMRLGPGGWYSCNLCNKKFKEKKSIDAHRYYHNREEKHLCTHCGARFKQKSDLHRHVRIHHNSMNPKNTIHCPHCYRSFTDIRYMRMHIRRYHGDEAQGSSGRMQGPSSTATKPYQRGNVRMELEDDNGQEMIDDDEDEEGMDWNEDEQQFLDEDDEDQRQMRTMEELEYLQYKYQNEAQSSEESSSEGGGGLQLTISCESCGVEVEAADIAEHVCSSEDDLQEEQILQDEEKDLEEDSVEIKKSVEQEPNTQALDESPTITLKNNDDEGNETQNEDISHDNAKSADTTPFEEIGEASKVTIDLKFDELVADPQSEEVTTTDEQSGDVVAEPIPKDNDDEIDDKKQQTIDPAIEDPKSAPSADPSHSEESSGTDAPKIPEL